MSWLFGINEEKDKSSNIYDSIFTYNTEKNFQQNNYYTYGKKL